MRKEERKIKITTAVYSDVGNLRKSNEDSFFISPDENLVIVCDGMGGQVAGGLASKIAVETIQDIYYNLPEEHLNNILSDIEENLGSTTRLLVASVRLANRRLFNMATKFPKLRGMGTTVVALTFDKNMASMVHVGDSRILRISEGKILQLTEDHSWLNELVEDKEINEEEVDAFTQRNVLTRALGTGPAVKIDIHCEKYKKDDLYFLCTDGLHNAVAPEEIKNLYEKTNEELEKLTQKLIEKAKIRDGSDNITVAVAKIKENSNKTQGIGISTTIPEENEKILSKEDKLLHDRYGDPKLKIVQKQKNPVIIRRNLVMAGVALFTTLVGFFLGLIAKTDNLNTNTRSTALFTVNKNTPAKESTVIKNEANKVVDVKTMDHVNIPETPVIPPSIIKRSKVSHDAVLAFVFFNSMNDYKKALLDKRGLILDQLYPYLNHNIIESNFTIFLIDDSNNVIHQTSGIRLPPVSE